jgi:hypothetical protein
MLPLDVGSSTHRSLQVSKSSLHEAQMRDAAFVDEAAVWAKELTLRESRGPGDMENAWNRLEARYGVPFGVFWSLRYRKPKTISAGIFARIHAAYRAECDRQMRILEHEAEITKTITGADHAAVVAVEALVRAKTRKKA